MSTDIHRLTDLERLRAVARYDLSNPALRADLNAIVEGSARRLEQSVTAVNILLDQAALTVAVSAGTSVVLDDATGVPAEWAYCSRVVTTGRPQIVSDLTAEDLGIDSAALAAGGLHSYAGVPLTTTDGQTLGAHCALHPEPGRYDERTVAVLNSAATRIMEALERYRRDG